MPIKDTANKIIQENFDLIAICGIDISMTLSDIDILAKALTSVIVLLIAIKRLLKGIDKKKKEKDIKK